MAQDLLNALTLGSLYLLFALGMSLAWGTIGILNFAHGSIFMFSAFAAYELVRRVSLPMPAMIGIGVLVGAALSVLVQVLAFEPIQRRAADPHKAELQILVGGIGIAIIPLAIAQHITKSVPFGYSTGSFRVVTYDLGFVRVSNVQLVILVAALGLAGVIGWWLRATRPGLALRAIGVDPEVASIMGVDRRRLALLHHGRRRRPRRAWPACCSPTTSAPSPRRPATDSCSRPSPRSSSAGSAASPASSSARWSSPGSRPSSW